MPTARNHAAAGVVTGEVHRHFLGRGDARRGHEGEAEDEPGAATPDAIPAAATPHAPLAPAPPNAPPPPVQPPLEEVDPDEDEKLPPGGAPATTPLLAKEWDQRSTCGPSPKAMR